MHVGTKIKCSCIHREFTQNWGFFVLHKIHYNKYHTVVKHDAEHSFLLFSKLPNATLGELMIHLNVRKQHDNFFHMNVEKEQHEFSKCAVRHFRAISTAAVCLSHFPFC